MVPIFAADNLTVRAAVLPGGWDYAKRVLLTNIADAQEYRMNYFIAAQRRNEFMQKALLNFPVPITLSENEYIEQIKYAALNFSQTMRITSPISAGLSAAPSFFASAVAETYLLIETDFYKRDVDDWKRLTPVWYLDHPSTSLLPMQFSMQTTESGHAVIAVDLAKLAYMYYRFCREALPPELTPTSDRSIEAFTNQYVLPNMLQSQLNISVLNRAIALANDTPPPSSSSHGKIPHPWIDVDARVDSALKLTISMLHNSNGSFDNLLQALPSVSAHAQRTALVLPDMADTSNVVWLQVLSRLKVFNFMMDQTGDEGVRVNQHYLSRLARTINAYDVREMIAKKLSPAVAAAPLVMIDRVLSNC